MLATTVVSMFDLPALVFHVTMLYFLLSRIVKCDKHYATSFYILFAVISSLDIVFVVLAYSVNRLPTYGVFPAFYRDNNSLARIGYFGTSYIEFCQFIGNMLFTANRFTILVLPHRFQQLWTARTLFAIITVMLVLPIPLVSFTFTTPVTFTVNENGGGIAVEFVEDLRYVPHWAHVVSLSLAASTSLLTLLMNAAIVVSMQMHTGKHSHMTALRTNDVRLAFCTLAVFAAQLMMAYYYYFDGHGFLEDGDVSYVFYITVSAMLSLNGSISLFIMSNRVRRDYLSFYRSRFSSFKGQKKSTISGVQSVWAI